MIQPNEYGTEDIQNELLDILKKFHNFCENKGIQYFLYGGSCLGGVRHKGFIPWDDDLDICLNRKNYNKLLSCFDECEGLNIHKTIWINRIQKNGAEAIRGYIPTLDVFIIDNAPDSNIKLKIKVLLLSLLQGMLKEEVSFKGFSVRYKLALFVTHYAGKLFRVERLREWYNKVSQIGNNAKTESVHCTNTSYKWIKKLYPHDTWESAELNDFEDSQFYIPKNYDSYLKICYGDYMILPNKDSRIPEHAKGE